MSGYLAVFALVFFATITPGPNNVLVMNAATRGGFRAALPGMAGVISGGAALLVLVSLGARTLLVHVPWVGPLATPLGAGMLAWMGWRMATPAKTETGSPLESKFLPVALFQFLNPKTWLGAMTAVAAAPNDAFRMPLLCLIYVLVPLCNLSIWALTGTWVSKHLNHPTVHRRFHQLTGGSLIGFALLLIFNPWGGGSLQ